VTVDSDAVAPIPDNVDAFATAALGLAAVTAHQGLERLGPQNGRRIGVTGAAGGVGSAAVAIAAARGAHVVAIVRDAARAEHLHQLGAAEVVDDASSVPQQSLHGVLDTVAGPLFEPLVRALIDAGVYSVVGAVGGDRVSFDVWELIRPVTLTGYSLKTSTGRRCVAPPPTYSRSSKKGSSHRRRGRRCRSNVPPRRTGYSNRVVSRVECCSCRRADDSNRRPTPYHVGLAPRSVDGAPLLGTLAPVGAGRVAADATQGTLRSSRMPSVLTPDGVFRRTFRRRRQELRPSATLDHQVLRNTTR
jgi:Zinc-binding dehydrogenase